MRKATLSSSLPAIAILIASAAALSGCARDVETTPEELAQETMTTPAPPVAQGSYMLGNVPLTNPMDPYGAGSLTESSDAPAEK